MTGRPSADAAAARGFRAALRNLGWLLASRGTLAILSLLYLGIATRTLGIVDFGRFALVTSAAQGLAVLVGFQTWQVVVRYGVDHRSRGDERALGRLLRTCLALDAVSAIAGIAIGMLILGLWSDALGIPPGLRQDCMILLAAQLVTIRSAATGIMRLNDQFKQAAIADSVTPVVRLAGTIVAAMWAPTLGAFLLAWSAAELATGAAYWWLLARSGDMRRIMGARIDLTGVKDENPHLARFVLNSNMASSLGLATKQLPLLLVGGFVGPAAAGAFRLAVQLAQALGKLSQLISRAAFPEIVRAMRQASSSELAAMSLRLVRMGALAALAVLIVVALIGKPALTLIGGDAAYASAYPLLLWLAVAGAIDLAVVGLEPVLLAADRSGPATVSRVAGVIVQLGLTLVLLPRIGAAGASIGVLGASIVGAVLMANAVFRDRTSPP